MIQYGEAFKRPFQDFKKLLIGILLSIIPIVNFFAFGYQLLCAKTAMKKQYSLPEWTKFGNLFKKGLAYIGITLIYLIPSLIFIFIAISIGAGALLKGIFTNDSTVTWIVLTGFSGTLIIALFFALVASYFLPVALLQYIEKEKFRASLQLKEVIKKSLQGKYFIVWFLISIYAFFLTFLLNFIPIIGRAIATFITGVTYFTAIGEIYPELK